MPNESHYDVIIIGTGAGGGTLAHTLADSGKRILLLERGQYVRREKESWSSEAVALKARYHTTEVWRDKHGKPLHPGMTSAPTTRLPRYFVGPRNSVG